MTPIHCLGILVNFTRFGAREALENVCQAAQEAKIQLLASPELCECFPGLRPCPIDQWIHQGAQGVISLGGDGSLLSAVHTLANTPLPLIGFNIGHLGYLTAVNEEGFHRALMQLVQGQYTLDARTTLTALTPDCPNGTPDALNDIVISRKESGHALALNLSLDDFPVARYHCDGIILSTPTGSTAYALSVGGPVVVPQAQVITLSVIAPHALTARPIVMPSTTRIKITVDAPDESATVFIDGRSVSTLHTNDAVTITTAAHPVQLIVPNANTNPYERLSRKLGWGSTFTR